LGSRKGIRPVKKLSGGVLAWLSAELHIAQLMPLPLTVSASVKSRLVLPLWYRLTWVVTDKGPLNGCVCVCERERERESILLILVGNVSVELEECDSLISLEYQELQSLASLSAISNKCVSTAA